MVGGRAGGGLRGDCGSTTARSMVVAVNGSRLGDREPAAGSLSTSESCSSSSDAAAPDGRRPSGGAAKGGVWMRAVGGGPNRRSGGNCGGGAGRGLAERGGAGRRGPAPAERGGAGRRGAAGELLGCDGVLQSIPKAAYLPLLESASKASWL